MDIDSIDQLLPQTQCRDCGYLACRPYAEAIINNEADINRCLPGGNETVEVLSKLLDKEIKPLYKDSDKSKEQHIAVIDEATCIGCVKCINACPVDAIIGAPKQMHSVIDKYCTGCELCIAPCPVDCISMIDDENGTIKNITPELSGPFIHISHPF
jgi:electron transport complex protein RnfB